MLQYRESHYKFSVKEILHELRQEIEINNTVYRDFVPSNIDIHLQLELFENQKSYNLEICDTFLLAFCNCFNIEILVVIRTMARKNFKMNKILCVVQPNVPTDASLPRRTFYLLKTADHYDPLLDYGKFINCCIFSFIILESFPAMGRLYVGDKKFHGNWSSSILCPS